MIFYISSVSGKLDKTILDKYAFDEKDNSIVIGTLEELSEFQKELNHSIIIHNNDIIIFDDYIE